MSRTPPQPQCCRICLQTEPQAAIISPCLCKGTTKYIHEPCLLQYIQKTKKALYNEILDQYYYECQICLHKIVLENQQKQEWRNWDEVKEFVKEEWVQVVRSLCIFVCQVVIMVFCVIRLREAIAEGDRLMKVLYIIAVGISGILGSVLAWVFGRMFAMKIVESWRVKEERGVVDPADSDSALGVRNQT